MNKKQNTTKANKTAGQAAADIEAKKLADAAEAERVAKEKIDAEAKKILEDAAKIIQQEERRKLDEVTAKFNVLIKKFEDETGYSIAPFIACLGDKILESKIALIKLQK